MPLKMLSHALLISGRRDALILSDESQRGILAGDKVLLNHQSFSLLPGKVLFGSAKLPPDSNRCLGTQLDTALYVN